MDISQEIHGDMHIPPPKIEFSPAPAHEASGSPLDCSFIKKKLQALWFLGSKMQKADIPRNNPAEGSPACPGTNLMQRNQSTHRPQPSPCAGSGHLELHVGGVWEPIESHVLNGFGDPSLT